MNDNKTGCDDLGQPAKPGTSDRVQADLPGTNPSTQASKPGTAHSEQGVQPGANPSDPAVCPGGCEPLTPDDISALAAKDEKPEQAMSAIDWLLWFMLRDVYQLFKRGVLDKETGSERKKEALDIWERHKEREKRDRDIINFAASLWRDVEMAASNYRLNRTLENADRVMEAIYGIPCGPSSGS